MIDKIGVLRWIRNRAEQIFEITGSILRLTETGGTLTTTGAEQTVYENNNPLYTTEEAARRIAEYRDRVLKATRRKEELETSLQRITRDSNLWSKQEKL